MNIIPSTTSGCYGFFNNDKIIKNMVPTFNKKQWDEYLKSNVKYDQNILLINQFFKYYDSDLSVLFIHSPAFSNGIELTYTIGHLCKLDIDMIYAKFILTSGNTDSIISFCVKSRADNIENEVKQKFLNFIVTLFKEQHVLEYFEQIANLIRTNNIELANELLESQLDKNKTESVENVSKLFKQ